MRFRLYREYGALNSKPVFDAFEQGLKSLGHEVVNTPDGIPVIWSVLWHGRMAHNERIYQTHCPIVIIEVGNLHRGVTWRVSLNHINSLGKFGNHEDLDSDRPRKLGVNLGAIKENRRPEIMIATQHQRSLQWQGQPPILDWVHSTVKEIRQYSDRKIIVRPHPRSPISLNIPGVEVGLPRQIAGSYDDFDIDYNQYKYLIETRVSGTLTKFKTAIAVSRATAGSLVTPGVPTFNVSTGVLTVPSTANVVYKNGVTGTTFTAGAQTAIASGATVTVEATPAAGYYFPHNFDADWSFTRS